MTDAGEPHVRFGAAAERSRWGCLSGRGVAWSFAAILFAFCAGLSQQARAEAILVRSAANGRVWQVNLAPTEPIRWAWATGADAARLTATNLTTGTVSAQVVTRTDGDLFGRCAIDVPDKPAEQVCTLAIEQYYRYGTDKQKTVGAASARVAYLPGIHQAGIDVRAQSSRYRGDAVEVFSYDAAWAAGSATATVASVVWQPEGGAAVAQALEGTSGYDVIAPPAVVCADLSLLFDGIAHWTRHVKYGATGLVFVIR